MEFEGFKYDFESHTRLDGYTYMMRYMGTFPEGVLLAYRVQTEGKTLDTFRDNDSYFLLVGDMVYYAHSDLSWGGRYMRPSQIAADSKRWQLIDEVPPGTLMEACRDITSAFATWMMERQITE